MMTVTKQEIGRWEDVPESPMKWSEYPYEEGEKRLPAVVSYGGGQNSTAMVIGLVLQGRPIDRIQFADTGGEKPETYEYVKLFEEWIQAQGYPKLTTVHNVNRDGRRVTLEENCRTKEMLPSIAYGFQYKRCSLRFKSDCMAKDINNWRLARETWSADEGVLKYIGYDVGEARRYKVYDDEKYIYEYPLLHDWMWSRSDCQAVITSVGLPLPPKSSCFFCPSTRKEEILDLRRNHPELFARALAMEDAAQKNLTSIRGLGGSFRWRDYVDADDEQRKLFDEVKSRNVACGCYDGGRPESDDWNETLAAMVEGEEKTLPFAIERAADLAKGAKPYRSIRRVDVDVDDVDVLQGSDVFQGSFEHASFAG